MTRRILAALLLLLPLPALAEPGRLCRAASQAAERAAGMPAHLLTSIGRIESGRRDPETGAFHPWPWTINAEGRGHFFPTKAAAIAAVQDLQARGVRVIDVGCFQINLRHHPNAFASLEEAFDPMANATYAARFLGQLAAARGGDWIAGAPGYHSQNEVHAGPYRQRLLAALAQEQGNPAPAMPPPPSQTTPTAVARAAPPAPAAGGGGAMLSNNAERAPVTMAAAGTQGRGLDAYRSMPVAIAGGMRPGRLLLALR